MSKNMSVELKKLNFDNFITNCTEMYNLLNDNRARLSP